MYERPIVLRFGLCAQLRLNGGALWWEVLMCFTGYLLVLFKFTQLCIFGRVVEVEVKEIGRLARRFELGQVNQWCGVRVQLARLICFEVTRYRS